MLKLTHKKFNIKFNELNKIIIECSIIPQNLRIYRKLERIFNLVNLKSQVLKR